MDHSELGENFGKFRFKFVEPHEHDAVLKVLKEYLYSAFTLFGYKPEGAEDLDGFFKGVMTSGSNLSFIAIDTETGEIAACRMVNLVPKERRTEVPPFKHKCNIDCFRICVELCKNIDLYEQFGVTEYPDMFGLCTVAKYRRLGLATELYTRGLNFLKRRGYKVVKCGFVNPYTRRAGHKLGYKELVRKRFLDMRDLQGNVLNPNCTPDDFLCFGIFDLTI